MSKLDETHPVIKFRWYDLGNGTIIAPDLSWAERKGWSVTIPNMFVAANAVYIGKSLHYMPHETFDQDWKEEKAKADRIVKALNQAKLRPPDDEIEELVIEAQIVIALMEDV